MAGSLQFLPLFVLALFGNALAAALVVRADKTPLLSKPRLKAEIRASLGKDTTLEGIEKSGLFWKVRTPDGAEGYVVVSKVHAPQSSAAKLKSAMRSVLSETQGSQTDNPRARSKNAVMGIRGLSDGDDLSALNSLRPNLAELEHFESFTVQLDQVEVLQSNVLKEADFRNERN